MKSPRLRLVALALSVVPAGCGAGTAAVVAGSGGSGGGGASPAITAFTVENPKEPERTRLAFQLSKRAPVELLYQAPGGSAPQPMSQAGANPRELEAGAQSIPWDFAGEPDLDPSFTDGVLVFARIPGVVEEPRAGENALTLGMGNDAPEVVVEDPAPEVDGVVPIRLRLSDSSGDAVDLRVEFAVEGDGQGWRPARPGGLVPGAPTPDPAVTGLVAPADPGTEYVFFWDTDHDLPDLERDARLRFTPVDPVAAGNPAETGRFRVDNNEEPIALVQEGPLVLNPDQRRGIPIPYELIDEEGDEAQVLFQWRRRGEEFPELPDLVDRPERVAELLADPALRRQYHLCARAPAIVQGRIEPVGPTEVRLPELASSAAQLVSGGLSGRTLEILRFSGAPVPLASSWSANPLSSPVAALPLGDGLAALVLDAPSGSTWRLREIELARGLVLRELALGSGAPTALALETAGDSALVASHLAGTWRVERVSWPDGANPSVVLLIEHDGTTEAGPIRGLARTSANTAWITVGSSLVQLDWTDPLAPVARTRLDDLAGPWGLVLDPLHPDRLWVAETEGPVAEGSGRIVAFDLVTSERRVLGARSPQHPDEPGFPAPRALALERGGARLLAVCEVDVLGRCELRGFDLGQSEGTTFALATLPSANASVATGPDGLRLVAHPGAHELRASGGLLERRTIAAHERGSTVVTVSEPFAAPLTRGSPWRISAAPRSASSPQGTRGVFVWDSADVQGGEFFVRATPIDSEPGTPSELATPRRIRWDQDPRMLAVTNSVLTDVAVGDLEGDGDLDVVGANGSFGDSQNTLTVFLRAGAHDFAPTLLALGGSGVTDFPQEVEVADLDGDGLLDIVSANLVTDDLTLFLQQAPGVFSAVPSLTLGGPASTDGPLAVEVADLDGDGDLDLASANLLTDNLTVFLQTGPGDFDPSPSVVLRDPRLTRHPEALKAADLDGDGDIDLACANDASAFLDRGLVVFFQASHGVFDPAPLLLPTGPWTTNTLDLEAADLDGDGDNELIAANPSSVAGANNLTVFFQTSFGGFDPDPLVLGDPAVTRGFNAVRAIDLDSDGDLDLASSNGGLGGSYTLAAFFQVSPGGFDPEPLVVGGPDALTASESLEVGDLDADGDLDLIVASQGCAVFRQASAGDFDTQPIELGNITLNWRPEGVAAGDLDGNGLLDLVSANYLGLGLSVFFQTSPGLFDPTPLQLVDIQMAGARSVTAADLDGDGDLDLASANQSADTLTIFFQGDPGVFDAPPVVLGNHIATDAPAFIAASDLDGDADLDLVSANQREGTLTIFLQTSRGSFDPQPSITLGGLGASASPMCVAAADLDGDGDQDLVSANQRTMTIFYQSSGAFDPTPSQVLSPPTAEDFAVWVTAADLDGDGDLDLASANRLGGRLAVHFQTAPGVFDPVPSLVLDSGVDADSISVAAADLDGDGDLDLVSANQGSSTLAVFLQTSPGRFDPTPLELGGPATILRPRTLIASDLDGDGDVDLTCVTFDQKLKTFLGGR